MLDSEALQARLAGVRDRIARAADRVGRDASTVRLVAVSKTFPLQYIVTAFKAGQLDFGENKLQEALPKIAEAPTEIRWHLVGHLQSNKVRKAASVFTTIHSIDGVELLRRVDEAAAAAGRTVDVLVQVDLARETTKHGADPDTLPSILAAAAVCRAARMRGLMLLPPQVEDPEEVRPYFATLRKLRDRMIAQGTEADMLSELSMGMSHDFEVAVQEGATMLRVGSAIFGSRNRP